MTFSCRLIERGTPAFDASLDVGSMNTLMTMINGKTDLLITEKI